MQRNRLLDTTLDKWLKVEWPQFSANLISVRARREDVLLYVLWTIDCLRDEECSLRNNLWLTLRERLRDSFIDHGMTATPGDLDYMTNVVTALTMACVGLTLKDDFDQQSLYSQLVRGLGEHWSAVNQAKQQLSWGSHTKLLEEWMVAYWSSKVFLTVEDEMDYDHDANFDIDVDSLLGRNSVRTDCLPAMISLNKTRELYMLLRDNGFIEKSVTEEQFLQIFGSTLRECEPKPIRWQSTKDTLIKLLQGIYDKWQSPTKPSMNQIKLTASNLILKKDGTKYDPKMKYKVALSYESDKIGEILATI